MDTLIHICTNPALISIVLLCFLCVKKINVLLAIIISTILAGLTAGLDINHIMNTFISGMGGNSETAGLPTQYVRQRTGIEQEICILLSAAAT